MPDILSTNDYAAAARQNVSWQKTGARTTIATAPFSVFEVAGNPGAGVLAGTSTAAGVVPTDATAGCPLLNAFGGSAVGRLTRVRFGSSVASRVAIYDLLFKAGAYSFNSNVSLAAQPSYTGRIPAEEGYASTELWVETVTAFTGAMSIAVGYTRGDGTAARTTGTVATGVTPTLGRMIQIPLAAGDQGIQKIESVLGSVATVGTFNLLVLRKLWEGRVKFAGDGDTHDFFKTGAPQVYDNSALFGIVYADSTAIGLPDLTLEIANK
jgi:hypothetical protein